MIGPVPWVDEDDEDVVEALFECSKLKSCRRFNDWKNIFSYQRQNKMFDFCNVHFFYDSLACNGDNGTPVIETEHLARLVYTLYNFGCPPLNLWQHLKEKPHTASVYVPHEVLL